MSVSEVDLKVLAARAKRLHRGNISAVVADLVAALRREEAADTLLELLGGERITEGEMQAIRDEIVAVVPKPRRKRRSAA